MFDLERPQVRVDREDVDQLQGGEDIGGSKQALQSSVKSVREQQRLPFTSEISVGSQVSHFSLGRLIVLIPKVDSNWT